MANTTVRGALSIHGKNPQFLVERVIRGRIYESLYWKEHCFALTAATIIDKALELKFIGGTYANLKPTEFMCLSLKLLQIQPEKAIVLEYLKAEEYKYLRALAVFYIRLTFSPLEVYQTLEPLLNDYRKIRYRSMDGSYSITTMDSFIDSLLRSERVCDIQLPRLTQRKVLEETEELEPRTSKLGKAILGERELLSDNSGSWGKGRVEKAVWRRLMTTRGRGRRPNVPAPSSVRRESRRLPKATTPEKRSVVRRSFFS
ncbi:PRP38-domain-containing protein [Atractiella rhizophila]|nr:PRP38-domain-containing protein [Atractiella rhizophila]